MSYLKNTEMYLLKARKEITKEKCRCLELGRTCNRCKVYNDIVKAITILNNNKKGVF